MNINAQIDKVAYWFRKNLWDKSRRQMFGTCAWHLSQVWLVSWGSINGKSIQTSSWEAKKQHGHSIHRRTEEEPCGEGQREFIIINTIKCFGGHSADAAILFSLQKQLQVSCQDDASYHTVLLLVVGAKITVFNIFASLGVIMA